MTWPTLPASARMLVASATIYQINEKALEFKKKTRAFVSEVDGGRTRNLRIDSPVL